MQATNVSFKQESKEIPKPKGKLTEKDMMTYKDQQDDN